MQLAFFFEINFFLLFFNKKMKLAKRVVDFIADYMQNIRDYRVYPAVQPG